jgi:ParB family chromosome partitioning protein
MAKNIQKIALSASRDIPFDRLVLSQANVRRIKAGVSIEELAADIARRTLLQSLTVRPVLDETGAETGMFEIPAGGRRYRALELLVRQKRLARNAPIPCVVRTDGIAEEDSLAENIQRAPLHPLDQFRAFQTLREKGQSEEEIAAAFFVSAHVVKQRLRLAAVSPKLLEIYAEDGMTLEQLMGFTVSHDHERQEQVWETIQRSWNKEPAQIRRLLTEEAVRASDKRAQYAGAEYLAAGGAVMRDLFQQDDGGWFQDAALLERVVAEKLDRDAAAIRAEGWKWVEVGQSFPYGHTYYGMRLIPGQQRPLTEEETAMVEALEAEAVRIEEEHADAEELPEEADRRLGEIEAALATVNERPALYEAGDIAHAGVFVSIDGSGRLRVERGYVRAEDEPPLPATEDAASQVFAGASGGLEAEEAGFGDPAAAEGDEYTGGYGVPGSQAACDRGDDEEEDAGRPLSDRLLTELTAYRTLALREALANDPGIAFIAALHVLCLKLFYPYGLESCLEIGAKLVMFGSQAPGLNDTRLAERADARYQGWLAQLPEDAGELWDVLVGFDSDSREALFAYCISLTINGVHDAYVRRPKAMAHASKLAEILSLDMVAAGWVPTAETYLGRVTKAKILEAVREAKGEEAAARIAQLKKGEMVSAAEQLLAGTGWLPEPLRTRGAYTVTVSMTETAEVGGAAMGAVTEGDDGEREYAPAVTASDAEQLDTLDVADNQGAPNTGDGDQPSHGIAAE